MGPEKTRPDQMTKGKIPNLPGPKSRRGHENRKTGDVAATGLVSFGLLFNRNPELIEPGNHAMLVFFLFLPLVGPQIAGSGYFQAVGKAVQATILSLSGPVVIFIPLLLILPLYRGLDGTWGAARAETARAAGL